MELRVSIPFTQPRLQPGHAQVPGHPHHALPPLRMVRMLRIRRQHVSMSHSESVGTGLPLFLPPQKSTHALHRAAPTTPRSVRMLTSSSSSRGMSSNEIGAPNFTLMRFRGFRTVGKPLNRGACMVSARGQSRTLMQKLLLTQTVMSTSCQRQQLLQHAYGTYIHCQIDGDRNIPDAWMGWGGWKTKGGPEVPAAQEHRSWAPPVQ